LRRQDLRGADLHEASAWGADLSGAVLSRPTTALAVRGRDLRAAQLGGATLTRAVLAQADLGTGMLAGADLREADLEGADLALAELAAEGATEERDGACFACCAVLTLLQLVPVVGPFFAIPVALWNCYVARKQWRLQRIAAAAVGAPAGRRCCGDSEACATICCMPTPRGAVLSTVNPAAAGAASR
jgi:uncharacterized protein YjbI with pentapeptide repeats